MVGAALLGLLVNLTVHLRGGGVFLRRVGKAAEPVKPHRAHKIAELGVLLLGLAGEAGDQRRAQRQPGQRGAQPGDRILNRMAVAAAAHRGQHPVVAVLDRQIEIGQNLLIALHRGDKFIGDALRIGIEHPNPADALDGVERVEQVTDGAGFAPILAVSGRVLRDNDELFDPLSREPAGFRNTVLERTGAQRAADQRDRTVAAAVGTTLGNF